VRFKDDRGRPELVAMLEPYPIKSPSEGTVTMRLREGDPVTPGAIIARIQRAGAEALDVRSPLPGRVSVIRVRKDEQVRSGEELTVLAPDKGQVWEALRALYLVGQPDDLAEVERYAHGLQGMPDNIKRQALLTAEAIRKRGGNQ